MIAGLQVFARVNPSPAPEKVVAMKVPPNSTIRELSEKLEQESGTTYNYVYYPSAGIFLHSEQILADLGITENSTIEFHVYYPGKRSSI